MRNVEVLGFGVPYDRCLTVCSFYLFTFHFSSLGTDRNNLVQISDLGENYPLPIESTTMWQNAEVFFIHHGNLPVKSEDLAISMATSGYYV